jgi:hypothetical protein
VQLIDALLLEPYPVNVWVALRNDSKGCGTMADPFGVNSAQRFDEVMSNLPADTPVRVHLGPGTFLTEGYSDEVSGRGWSPKPGMKIVGAGTEVTTLQLVNATAPSSAHFFAIGHPLRNGTASNLLDFFEVSDLTIDCGLDAAGSNVACGAVRIMGNHARIRRVKVVNWGTKSNQRPCYVLAAIVADSFYASGAHWGTEVANTGIEECIAVDPGNSPSDSSVTVLHVGPSELTGSDRLERFGSSPFLRNCFVDCGGLSDAGGWRPQFRALSMGACRAGVVEGNLVRNTWIGGPYQEKASTREIVIRGNHHSNVVAGPYWKLGQSCAPVWLQSLVRSQGIASAISGGPHYLGVGDRVSISSDEPGSLQFDGVFRVNEAPSPTSFNYCDVRADGTATSPYVERIFSVDKAVVEGNVIELADFTTQPTVPGGSGLPTGLRLIDGSPLYKLTPEYLHGDFVIHNNSIRILQGRIDQPYIALGMRLEGAKTLHIRNNGVELVEADPLRNARCGAVRYFNNKTPAGLLQQGLNLDASKRYDELETDVEDALVLTFMRRR